MPKATIKRSEFDARRQKVLRALVDAVALVFAGDKLGHEIRPWRPDPNFEYLTGITDEPGAVLLLDPKNPVKARRAILFLEPLNPELERWDGLRHMIGAQLKKDSGFETVMRTNYLPRFLNEAATRSKTLTCLHQPATINQPISNDLETYNKLAARIPGLAIESRTDILPKLRSIKSPAEIKAMSAAIDATLAGLERLLAAMQPGANEAVLQSELENGFANAGGRGLAYAPIVGAGLNSTVLHYIANDQDLAKGDVLIVDAGTNVEGYAADITRTYPISGKFSKRQAEIYSLVLKAQKAAIAAVKPGATLAQIDAAARKPITAAGLGDHFYHGIGHHLGLEVHDATPEGPLKAGMVVTIEPGVYIADEKIGVRIEDDILVTPKGRRNLSSAIPKEIPDVEAQIKRCRKRR